MILECSVPFLELDLLSSRAGLSSNQALEIADSIGWQALDTD